MNLMNDVIFSFIHKASPAGKKNIWGSPHADNSQFQKPVNNTLQALFASAKQAALRDFPGVNIIY